MWDFSTSAPREPPKTEVCADSFDGRSVYQTLIFR